MLLLVNNGSCSQAAITNAIRDTLHGDYAAGNAKFLNHLSVQQWIALGVCRISYNGRCCEMIMQYYVCLLCNYQFSVINGSTLKKKSALFINGVLGMAGWAVYLYIDRISTMLTATFVSGLVLAVASHILARILKTPVTTMLIPAILTIVPEQECIRPSIICFCQTWMVHYQVSYIR